ncbi:hypothetical protein ACLMJK_004634 [Lecanora helva]
MCHINNYTYPRCTSPHTHHTEVASPCANSRLEHDGETRTCSGQITVQNIPYYNCRPYCPNCYLKERARVKGYYEQKEAELGEQVEKWLWDLVLLSVSEEWLAERAVWIKGRKTWLRTDREREMRELEGW